MRGMRKGKDKDNNDYRNHFGEQSIIGPIVLW